MAEACIGDIKMFFSRCRTRLGHDAHTAMLLGALELLAAKRQEWSGEIIAAFERGEETGYGVFPLLRALTERYDGIDGCFALHFIGYHKPL